MTPSIDQYVRQLADSSNHVGEVITAIAEQANLLALNATIEATLADKSDATSARITNVNDDGEKSVDLPWSSPNEAMVMHSFTKNWSRE